MTRLDLAGNSERPLRQDRCPFLAHFDVCDAATPCLKLRDERTPHRLRNLVAIDPTVWTGRVLQARCE